MTNHQLVASGETSWHCDLATSPFDTNGMVTCWIALTAIETEADSPLEFATGISPTADVFYWKKKSRGRTDSTN